MERQSRRSPRSRRVSLWCARVGGARGVPEAAELDGRVDEAVEDLGIAGGVGGVINRVSFISITHKNNMSYIFLLLLYKALLLCVSLQ